MMRIFRALLAWLLDLYGGGRGLFTPEREYASSPVRKVVVLSAGQSPTADIYLRTRLQTSCEGKVQYVDVNLASPRQLALGEGVLVIVVRFVPRKWLRALYRKRDVLAGVVYLMDDDIPAAMRATELPFSYALKTAWRHATTRRSLARLCSEIWVSTPELARRYATSSPKLYEPAYLPASQAANRNSSVYFYHGTWAHRREIKWLVPVVSAVQARFPNAWFEIMGTDRVRRLFRGIPRVRVIHPMSWQDYLAYAGTVRYQVGLAPCLDTDFNRGRSHVKLFDITRLGAAGIYSNVIPYSDKVLHGTTGWLCENTHDAWVMAIGNLLSDAPLRNALYQQARSGCEQTREKASAEGIFDG